MTLNKSILFKKHRGLLLLVALLGTLVGCRKQVELDAPETNPVDATIYTKDATAAAVMTYIYTRMAGTSFATGTASIEVYAGLTSDEFTTGGNVRDANILAAYVNSPSMANTSIWKDLYQYIYVSNAVIEGIAHSKGGMTDSVKRQLVGEARFMRAFLHFYAVNLYGNVPYVDTTDAKINSQVTRQPVDQVYSRILEDLLAAKDSLTDEYRSPIGAILTKVDDGRLRPNKWAARALLARVYLYMKRWAEAEAEASAIIAETGNFALSTDLAIMTRSTSKEPIWHLQPVVSTNVTPSANMYLITTIYNNTIPVSLRPAFVKYFETIDKRLQWIDSSKISNVTYYRPSKYKLKTVPAGQKPEYTIVFRLAEQYLIRAEARVQQDKLAEGKADMQVIRARAGLPASAATTKDELLLAIEAERAKELFAEWGHRWFDLKRTGRINPVMDEAIKDKTNSATATWNPDMQLYPIPANDILLNPNLAPQNAGY